VRALAERGHEILALLVVLVAGTLVQAQDIDFSKASLAWTLPWDADWVTAVSFVGPGRVAAGNNLGQILVWDLPAEPGAPAPPPARRYDGHSNTVNRLLSTPDGRWLLSASNDHTIRYWDTQAAPTRTDTVVLNQRAREEAARRKKTAPKPSEAKVAVQDAAKVLDGHKEWVLGLARSADGKTFVSGDDMGEIIVWDLPAGKELRRWQIKGWTWALALAPDVSSLLVSERIHLVFDSGRHAGLKLWDPHTGKLQHDLGKQFDKQMLSAAAFSPDGKVLAVCRGGEIDGTNGKVTLLGPAGKKLRELTPGHLNGATDIAFHPDGKHVVSAGRDTTVRIWRIDDGKLLKELGPGRGGQFKDWIHAISIAPDGKWLAAADMAGQVQIWALGGK
jgi:WD40 repeat protein